MGTRVRQHDDDVLKGLGVRSFPICASSRRETKMEIFQRSAFNISNA